MYSRLVPVYEARLFRLNAAGEEEAIPGIGRYVKGYESPAPMQKREVYMESQEVLDRLAQLVTFIAKKRKDGYQYVVTVRWVKYPDGKVPLNWEFHATSAA